MKKKLVTIIALLFILICNQSFAEDLLDPKIILKGDFEIINLIPLNPLIEYEFKCVSGRSSVDLMMYPVFADRSGEKPYRHTGSKIDDYGIVIFGDTSNCPIYQEKIQQFFEEARAKQRIVMFDTKSYNNSEDANQFFKTPEFITQIDVANNLTLIRKIAGKKLAYHSPLNFYEKTKYLYFLDPTELHIYFSCFNNDHDGKTTLKTSNSTYKNYSFEYARFEMIQPAERIQRCASEVQYSKKNLTNLISKAVQENTLIGYDLEYIPYGKYSLYQTGQKDILLEVKLENSYENFKKYFPALKDLSF